MKHAIAILVLLLIANCTTAQLVLPGDFPDPSVIKINDSYWATATSSNWSPVFPLLQSKDLINWETKGSVFTTLPGWADYYFWAPEISYDKGKVYVYYSAHRKGGNLCVGVASADDPSGPYTDHGPLVCQEAGSIDAFPVRDASGKLYLIWKEDGNSVRKPTPIWISEMSEDRKSLVGEKREMFRNDTEWEGNLVEGVSIIQRGGYYFAFYAGAGCCGRECNYATGIARAKELFGPWEKYSGNPVIVSDDKWVCPGHGTPVEKNGRYYFLYHSYEKTTNVYTGRQGLLKEFVFTDDNWIKFVETPVPSITTLQENIRDEFDGTLSPRWQWSVFNEPQLNQNKGVLELSAGVNGVSMIGQKIYSGEYSASTTIDISRTSAQAGIAVIGDDGNYLALLSDGRKLVVEKVENGKHTRLSETPAEKVSKTVTFRLSVKEGNRLSFAVSYDGKSYKTISPQGIDQSMLPPWDRALRVGLLARGQNQEKAVFENFILYH